MTPLQDTMYVGLLYTVPIQDHETSSIGKFELELRIPRSIFLASTDKQGFVKTTISTHLASAIFDTEVPVDYWCFITDPELAMKLSLPNLMNFSR